MSCQTVSEQSTHIISVQGSVAKGTKRTVELTALQMSPLLQLQQAAPPHCHLNSPSWPVSVPSASCPVPCEWRKAPILADQAALCRTLAFFVGGFPYKIKHMRNISGTGEEANHCNWPARHASLPWGDFQATTSFTNTHSKKKQQVK